MQGFACDITGTLVVTPLSLSFSLHDICQCATVVCFDFTTTTTPEERNEGRKENVENETIHFFEVSAIPQQPREIEWNWNEVKWVADDGDDSDSKRTSRGSMEMMEKKSS